METKYFWYESYDKNYIIDSTSNAELLKYLEDRTYNSHLHSTTAIEYYYNAKVFSEQVKSLTSGIKQSHAIDEDGNKIQFSTNLDGDILVPSSSNNPLLESSNFNEQRKNVIRRSIETNLAAAIANYNEYSTNSYEYRMPVLQETDWEKITNNISVVSFLQGIPIGHKYYNNYCVITNNNNKETVKKENVYIIAENFSTGEREYHTPGCKELMQNSNLKIVGAYSNISFLRQTVRISEGNYKYFYPQAREDKFITSCYHCIVGANSLYDVDQIIKGKIEDEITGETITQTNSRFKEIRKLYLTALARERFSLIANSSDAVNFAIDTSSEAITGASLDVRKTSNKEASEKVKKGDIIKYTIEVENIGNKTVKEVRVEDDIPNNTTYVNNSGIKDASKTQFSEYIGDLEPGEVRSVYFYVVVDEIASDETVITNQAVVFYEGGSLKSDKVILQAKKTDKITVQITCNETEATLGQELIYTIKVSNNTTETVKNIKILNEIPQYTILLDADGNEVLNTKIEESLSSLAAGATKDYIYTVKIENNAPVGSNITNEASASADDKTATSQVKVSIVHPLVATINTNINEDEYVIEGDKIEYTVTVTNMTEKEIKNITVYDKASKYTSFVGETSKTISLKGYETKKVTFTLRVDEVSDDGIKINNYATISTTEYSQFNTDIVTVIGGKKVYLADVVKVGDYVSYTGNGYSKWRVMSITGSGKTGYVTLISAGAPSSLSFQYTTPANYISSIKTECAKYLDTTYAKSVRNVGTTSAGELNSSYTTELNSLKNNGLLNIGATYWVGYAEKYVSPECSNWYDDYYAYYVSTTGTYEKVIWGNSSAAAKTCGVRPIVTLKASLLKVGGSGTSSNPYKIKIGE